MRVDECMRVDVCMRVDYCMRVDVCMRVDYCMRVGTGPVVHMYYSVLSNKKAGMFAGVNIFI
jgi:hypothetical protein